MIVHKLILSLKSIGIDIGDLALNYGSKPTSELQ